MRARIDVLRRPESRAPWISPGLLVAAACAACSSHSDGSTPPQCTSPSGSYVLAIAPTGQSENLAGTCSATDPPQNIEVSFPDGGVSVNGENCQLCSTSSCQMDVLCGESVTCPGAVVPFANPTATYVQTVSFVLPLEADASTPNAAAELGPDYCGYIGTASVASP
ncbi:MAG TPA: hypothetical protein VEK07_02750 [Polyangiaceae bacterium]|nr:hypothetical protein [Polyangiaceae bacterium]